MQRVKHDLATERERERVSHGMDIPQSISPTCGHLDFLCAPGGSAVKNPPTNARDTDLIPGLRRSSGEGHNNPPQYSCLGNLMDRGAWQAAVHEVTKRIGHSLPTKQQQQNLLLTFKSRHIYM